MNSSLYRLDRATYLKSIAVAGVMAAAVLIIGQSARLDHAASAAPVPLVAQPLLQPSPQPFWRAAPSRRPLMPAAKPEASKHAMT